MGHQRSELARTRRLRSKVEHHCLEKALSVILLLILSNGGFQSSRNHRLGRLCVRVRVSSAIFMRGENALLVRVHHPFKFVLKLIAITSKLHFDNKCELAAFLPLRLADDVAAEFSDQLTTDM